MPPLIRMAMLSLLQLGAPEVVVVVVLLLVLFCFVLTTRPVSLLRRREGILGVSLLSMQSELSILMWFI